MRASEPRDLVRVRALDREFVANRGTLEAAKWLSARGLLEGVQLAQDAGKGERLKVALRGAPGVAIPAGSFEAAAIRFNEAGEVVEIVPASSDAGCVVVGIDDPENPGQYWLGCMGNCSNPGLRCTLAIDIVTLEISCPCL